VAQGRKKRDAEQKECRIPTPEKGKSIALHIREEEGKDKRAGPGRGRRGRREEKKGEGKNARNRHFTFRRRRKTAKSAVHGGEGRDSTARGRGQMGKKESKEERMGRQARGVWVHLDL